MLIKTMINSESKHMKVFPAELSLGDQVPVPTGNSYTYITITRIDPPTKPCDDWLVFYEPTIGPGGTGVCAPKNLRILIKKRVKHE